MRLSKGFTVVGSIGSLKRKITDESVATSAAGGLPMFGNRTKQACWEKLTTGSKTEDTWAGPGFRWPPIGATIRMVTSET